MKKFFFLIIYALLYFNSYPQNVGISDNVSFNPSFMLHIKPSVGYSNDLFSIQNNSGTPFFHVKLNGNVGIGTLNPTEKLDLIGNFKFSGALMPNNLSGNSGQVLKSNGSGTAPSWIAAVTPDNIYVVESTSSLAVTSGTFTTIPGETITINGLNIGDRILIWFSGNMYMSGSGYNNIDIALYINGTIAEVGGFVRVSLDTEFSYLKWQNYSTIARYNVISPGNYTFDIRARRLLISNTIYVGGDSLSATEGVLMIFVLRN